MSLGSKLFKDWIARSGYNSTEAAEYLGLLKEEVSLFKNGVRRPVLEKAVRIEGLTGIPTASWASTAANVAKPNDSHTADNSRIDKR